MGADCGLASLSHYLLPSLATMPPPVAAYQNQWGPRQAARAIPGQGPAGANQGTRAFLGGKTIPKR
jgi:hypothetical protein